MFQSKSQRDCSLYTEHNALLNLADYVLRCCHSIRYYLINEVFQSFSYTNISTRADLRNHKFLDTPIR